MSKNKLSLYQEVIHKSRYARWRDEDGRREDWDETCERYVQFFVEYLKENNDYVIPKEDQADVLNALKNMDIMPSMRALMTAGDAARSAELSIYNCSALAVDSVRAFSEHMFVLMSGTGSGFSVERFAIEQLPEVPEELFPCETTITVSDSRKGWCVALNQLMMLLYAGSIPKWDVSKVRPEGARLKTFGGFASGPEPLVKLFEHVIEIMRGAKGRKLKPIEIFSIMCFIAQIVVIGGVRRSATICLFDKDDTELRSAKSGAWWVTNPQFAMANISAVFETKPSPAEFLSLWHDLVISQSGEPGVFNREATWKKFEEIGRKTRDEKGIKLRTQTNPCSEVVLLSHQTCNLSAIAIRPKEALVSLKEKARLASIIGTWQSCVTNFDYLRKSWKKNIEDERLLGVAIAGMMDHEIISSTSDKSKKWLSALQDVVWETNKKVADDIGINHSASVTAIKPAGNSGELYNVSSGIHPRYAKYYIRTIRQSKGDTMTKFLMDNGVPWEVSEQNNNDYVFSFPIKSPEGCITRDDMTAIEQMEHWLHTLKSYTTHTISCTIYVREHEWVEVGAWVYKHFDDIIGLSFLPYSDHSYKQAPYQPITEEEYNKAMESMPKELDWSDLSKYEETDTTTVSQDFACVGDKCTL